MPKLLTIIIPTYNMEAYLHTCLSSLILPEMKYSVGGSSSTEGSRDRGFEALIIIDGATDRSEQIAREYETKYPDTFRVITKENGHYGSCINRGLQEAQGKYIKVLDADDHFDTPAFAQFLQFLDTIVAKQQDTPPRGIGGFSIGGSFPAGESGDRGLWAPDAIIHFAQMFYQDGSLGAFVGVKPEAIKTILGDKETLTIEHLIEHEQLHPQMHNIVYRTDILRQMGYSQLNGVFYSDTQWRIMPMGFAKTIALFPQVVYKYLSGRPDQSVAPNVQRRNFDHEIQLMTKMYEDCNTYQFTDLGKKYVDSCIYGHLRYLYTYGINNEVFNEPDVRRLDTLIQQLSPSHWHQLSSIKVRIHAYRHTVTISFWRKYNHRLFDILETTIAFFWDPYKKLKAIIKNNSKKI